MGNKRRGLNWEDEKAYYKNISLNWTPHEDVDHNLYILHLKSICGRVKERTPYLLLPFSSFFNQDEQKPFHQTTSSVYWRYHNRMPLTGSVKNSRNLILIALQIVGSKMRALGSMMKMNYLDYHSFGLSPSGLGVKDSSGIFKRERITFMRTIPLN